MYTLEELIIKFGEHATQASYDFNLPAALQLICSELLALKNRSAQVLIYRDPNPDMSEGMKAKFEKAKEVCSKNILDAKK